MAISLNDHERRINDFNGKINVINNKITALENKPPAKDWVVLNSNGKTLTIPPQYVNYKYYIVSLSYRWRKGSYSWSIAHNQSRSSLYANLEINDYNKAVTISKSGNTIRIFCTSNNIDEKLYGDGSFTVMFYN